MNKIVRVRTDVPVCLAAGAYGFIVPRTDTYGYDVIVSLTGHPNAVFNQDNQWGFNLDELEILGGAQ